MRFIPTHVGYIEPIQLSNTVIPVHPHACGVHLVINGTITAANGFIPTHVGYIIIAISQMYIDAVHPHACGVHAV